jgi:hypothetical protein
MDLPESAYSLTGLKQFSNWPPFAGITLIRFDGYFLSRSTSCNTPGDSGAKVKAKKIELPKDIAFVTIAGLLAYNYHNPAKQAGG